MVIILDEGRRIVKIEAPYAPYGLLLIRLNGKDDYPFLGEIKNKDMIGKSKQDYIERWDTEHLLGQAP